MKELIDILKIGIPILAVITLLGAIVTWLPKKIQDVLGIAMMFTVVIGIMVGLFLYFATLIGMFVSLFL